MKYKILLVILFFSLSNFLLAEEYFFSQYASIEGLNHPYIYSISQDSSGFLWIGTQDGLYRFDGFDFEFFTAENGLPGDFVSQLFTDSQGRIWIGFQNGAIALAKGNDFIVYHEGLESGGGITDFTEDDEGSIWALVQNGYFIRIRNQSSVISYTVDSEGEALFKLHFTKDNHFLLGTENSIFSCHLDEAENEITIEGYLEDYPGSRVVEIIPTDNSRYYILSQDEGVYLLSKDEKTSSMELKVLHDNMDGTFDNLQDGLMDEKGILWFVKTGSGIVKFSRELPNDSIRFLETIDKQHGLQSENIRCIYEDKEGVKWLGLFGEGLLRYVPRNISFYRLNAHTDLNRLTAISGLDSIIYAFEENKFFRISKTDPTIREEVKISGLPARELVKALYMDEEGNAWIGMESSGIYQLPAGSTQLKRIDISSDELQNSINHITGRGSNIWISTRKGICLLNKGNSSIKWFVGQNLLPHNDIKQVYLDNLGNALISTLCNEIYYINPSLEVKILQNSGLAPFTSINNICKSKNNDYWVSTIGNGVYRISDMEVQNYRRESGLFSDYCYSMSLTSEGMPVISHRGGLSVINPENNEIRVFNSEQGILSSQEFYRNTVFCEPTTNIWFGSSKGLVQVKTDFDDTGILKPELNIKSVRVNGDEIQIGQEAIILKPGQYDLTVDYVGIYFVNPGTVRYKTMLEGFNQSWIEEDPFVRSRTYSNLGHGDYTFKIIATNDYGLSTELKEGFVLHIKKPFYLRIWFFAAGLGLLFVIFFSILKYRESRQKAIQRMLEVQLDERTHEVVAQKERIERINKDLTESINYAERIQVSMLPALGLLKDNFADGFIFYQPRSIVSGDFYWFDKISDDKFLIVCADSTGHGVPGAFMSMIGITTIKDFCLHEDFESPARLLNLMDESVKSSLSMNEDFASMPDGMDMSVALVDLRTRELSVASAMNPFILHRGEEQLYFKGSRYSVGGHDEPGEKVFENHVFKMDSGDKLFFFSDGFVDQFGGPQGKKYKISGLKKTLLEIQGLSMHRQKEYLEWDFNNWKGQIEQVDDVLLMGVQF